MLILFRVEFNLLEPETTRYSIIVTLTAFFHAVIDFRYLLNGQGASKKPIRIS